MVKVLGYELSDCDVAEYEKAPKLVVNKWDSGKYYTLSPEYNRHQMFYDSLFRSNEYPYYDRDDLQNMADEFNNDEDLNENYKHARVTAINNQINVYIREIKQDRDKLDKLRKSKNEFEVE